MYIVRDIYINVKLSQLIGPKFVKMLMKDRNARCTYAYIVHGHVKDRNGWQSCDLSFEVTSKERERYRQILARRWTCLSLTNCCTLLYSMIPFMERFSCYISCTRDMLRAPLETAFYVCSLPRLTMRREEKYIFATSPSSFWAARTMDQESNI